MFQLVCGLEGAVVSIAEPLRKHNRSNPGRSLAVKLDKLSDLIARLFQMGRFINVNSLDHVHGRRKPTYQCTPVPAPQMLLSPLHHVFIFLPAMWLDVYTKSSCEPLTMIACSFLTAFFSLISYFYIQRVDGNSSRSLCILLIRLS